MYQDAEASLEAVGGGADVLVEYYIFERTHLHFQQWFHLEEVCKLFAIFRATYRLGLRHTMIEFDKKLSSCEAAGNST